MGCTTSKIDNDDTVRRCKERRRLIKSAVLARHHLAAAHSDYLHSLRRTGLALFDFSSGESLSVSSTQSPPIFLDPPPRSTPLYSISSFSASPPPPSFHTPLPAPPPPPPPYSPSIASSRQSSLSRARRAEKKTTKPAKLPNLPSFTTYSGTPTPSQASSAWNWENFYPPSPPGSEFYNSERESKSNSKSKQLDEIHHHHHHLDDNKECDDEETEQEEVHCSEWGDHYTTTTTSDTESRNEDNDEIRSDFGSSVCDEMPQSKKSSFRLRSEKMDDAGSSVSWSAATEQESNMRMVVRHRDLVEIAAGIKEYFEKAASAGDSVSVLLETGRAQLDRSFRQLKKTVYHSNSMLSSLSSTWTSKPPLGIRYQLDSRSICKPGDSKSHCSTLEKLLAWEKKLYEEVKAREGVNMEHEKKLSSLQSQEYKGEDDAKLDKTKTSIRRLQSLIVVTSQAVSTTSSAIIHARDTELAPQLADLCHGFMYMWRSMNQFHEVQSHIIQQVRGLVHQASKGQATSELHRQATNHLEATVSGWHTNFCRLIKYHRDYIHSLHGWLKLTLLQVSNDTSVSSQASELFAFLDEWKQALDRCPDTVASEAIKSFVNVVHSISLKQTEELKIKRKAESASRDLEKKASALRNLEKKFYQSYSTVGLGIPDGGEGLDSRDPLAEKKLELAEIRRRVEEETVKHARAVEATRAMTLNNIQTGLPGVFQAVTGFSGLFAEALQVVCTRSYNIK